MRFAIFIVTSLFTTCLSSYKEVLSPIPYLDVSCYNENITLDNAMPTYPQTKSFESLEVTYCPQATSSLARTLAEHNISVSSLRSLSWSTNRDLVTSELQGLPINSIYVYIAVYQKQLLNIEALAPLKELRTLTIMGWRPPVILPPIPATTKLVKVTLGYGQSVGQFGACQYLEELTLQTWDARSAPENWLGECHSLHSLTIRSSKNGDVGRMLQGATSIRNLIINACDLISIPQEIWTLKQLEKLDLSYNQIYTVRLDGAILPRVMEVNLEYNKLQNCRELNTLIDRAPGLVDLNVALNPSLDLCCLVKELKNRGYNLWPRSLKRLDAHGTGTSSLCFDYIVDDATEFVNACNSQITAVKFEDLPMSIVKNIQKINLTGNPVTEISLQEAQYKSLPSGMTVLDVNVTVECDCQNAWLARAMREKRLSLEARCADGSDLGHLDADAVECDRYQCGACTCRRLWRDNTTLARCDSGDLQALTFWEGLKELRASDNRIEAINTTELPDSLTLLDLRRNRISRISAAEVSVLFAERNRSVLLAGNPFVCDCAARPLLLALHKHRAQVQDYDWIMCVNDGRFVSELGLDELCAEPLGNRAWLISGPLIGISILVGIFAGVFYRYERKVKEFLFTRGYCLSCLREEDLDDDRPYDAFVSFAHLDDEFVSEHLLPELEAVRHYRLCVHYRDWAAGGWIPEQISQSVHLSKRVIIVLSRNFLASTWALMEFRLAQTEAAEERRARLIVVVLDDVLEENIDVEIKAYLAMNTYVLWGDPLFWEKLTFALPRNADIRGDEMVPV